MSKSWIPEQFFHRLDAIMPGKDRDEVIRRMDEPSPLVWRVNTLQAQRAVILSEYPRLRAVTCLPEAVVGDAQDLEQLRAEGVFDRGRMYQQSLSSMLAVAALDPGPDERILDLCAAPGSKTSQIAARMQNTGMITAVEAVRARYYKLRSVLNLLGVLNTRCLCLDGRRFQSRDGLFDRVLVDAPCSSEGRFKRFAPRTFAYWSPRKIQEMVRKQRGLLLNASRQLAPGGTMIYATCTFAPEENEGVVDWFLRKTSESFAVEPVVFDGIPVYPPVREWGHRRFDERVAQCCRVLPGEMTEGFFIAKFRKD